MLKIKDNVDLKELEKFGFRRKEDEVGLFYGRYSIRVYIDDNRIVINNNDPQTIDLLYDLIKAGLVEKVGE